jgi:hypothetical protein
MLMNEAVTVWFIYQSLSGGPRTPASIQDLRSGAGARATPTPLGRS